jgi:uncharacterized protein YndB with AHSA1/START domain
MTGATNDVRTASDNGERTLAVVLERDLPHPREKVWRALTEPHLIAEWLQMENAFAPVPGHRFELSADWGTITCEVTGAEPPSRLEYTWNAGDLRSRVVWELTPTASGTRLRMEQTGFRPDQPRYYGGAKAGWPRFLDGLERVLGRAG